MPLKRFFLIVGCFASLERSWKVLFKKKNFCKTLTETIATKNQKTNLERGMPKKNFQQKISVFDIINEQP